MGFLSEYKCTQSLSLRYRAKKSLTMEFVPFCRQMACAFQLVPNHFGNATRLVMQGRTCIKLRKHPHPDQPLWRNLDRLQWHAEGEQRNLLETVGMQPFKIMRIHYWGLLPLPFASNAIQSAICKNQFSCICKLDLCPSF